MGLIRSDETTIMYLLFKRINPATSIGVSNLKDEIEKAIVANFGNNVKIFLITYLPIPPLSLIRESITRILFVIY